MIPWIDELAKDWGKYIRSNPRSGYPSAGVEHKMVHGEISSPPGPSNPNWRQDPNVMEFNAFLQDPETEGRLKLAAFSLYAYKGEPKERAKRSGLSKTEMYTLRDPLHYAFSGWLSAKELERIRRDM